MRAVDATGSCTVPLDVDSDNVRLDASNLSIVPPILNVVDAGGVDWAASVGTAGPIGLVPRTDCANAPLPETTTAESSATESRFLMTEPFDRQSIWTF
jgi:hypothetical protein